MPAGGTADDEAGRHQLIGGATGGCGAQRDLGWLAPYFGMELLDSDACRCRGVDIADERLVLSPGDVLRPQRRGSRWPSASTRIRLRGRLPRRYRHQQAPGLDRLQCSSAAGECAVLLEKEPGGHPRQPVADDAQGGQIDAETLIADH